MANITGTEGADTLKGTPDDDFIQGLGGNDLIIGSSGSDFIDGNAGHNVLDYDNSSSIISSGIEFVFNPDFSIGGSLYSVNINKSDGDKSYIDRLKNIETIIGSTKSDKSQFNQIIFSQLKDGKIDINLAKNQITTSSELLTQKTLNIKNFHDVNVSASELRIEGDDLDNQFSIGGKAEIIASKGNDTMYLTSSTSTNPGDLTSRRSTIDYSKLDRAVTVTTNIPFTNVPPTIVPLLNIDKHGLGTDKLIAFLITDSNTFNLNKIIGAAGKANTIDGNSKNNSSSIFPLIGLDVDLSKNLLAENTKNAPSPRNNAYSPIEIVNFVNVIGSKLDDKIVGANKNGKLTGGGGNDTITGGNKNDIITGSDSTAQGVGECDTLTGGGGRDKFVLGDKNGAYYLGKGSNDYATITDFDLFNDSICIGNLKDYSFAIQGKNEVDLYSGKDVKTRDLIAKIHITSGISAGNRNSRSIAGSNPNLDMIVAKMDIITGTNS